MTGDGDCKEGPPVDHLTTTSFFESDPLLGPAELPKDEPVGPLMAGYQRFGPNLPETPAGAVRFRSEFFSGNPASPWNWPPNKGFEGQPTRTTLKPGTKLDRFGYEGGTFLAPREASFAERALPPQSLDTPIKSDPPPPPPPMPQSNYHAYCVMQPFDVDAGPLTPWFGQPGLGMQYVLNPEYFGENDRSMLSVGWLVRNGYLVEETPRHAE